MTPNPNNPAEHPADCEIVSTRVLAAPRAAVFAAFSDPRQLALWWGPAGFTNTIHEFDLRPGGRWRITLRGPDGATYDNEKIFTEVVAPERVVFRHLQPMHHFLMAMTFAERDGATTLTWRMQFESAADCARVREFIVAANEQNFDRLEAHLARLTATPTPMTAKNSPPESTADREILVTRTFDAPRELVWEAWTNPAHVGRWWGPNGFTTTTEKMDLRPGGVWKHVMHGPDGTHYPNESVFKEVVKPERIVYAHAGRKEGGPGTQFEATWTFEALSANRTKVTLHSVFPSAADLALVIKNFGAFEGAKQTLARLGEHLAKLPAVPEFVLTRVFDAPRALLWKMFTEPEHMQHWLGPKGTTGRAVKMDFRPGGIYHYCLRSPDGREMWGRSVYWDIVPPQRLVYLNSFSDAQGGLARHPLSPSWPLEMLSTFLFEEEGARTRLTLKWLPWNASAEEIKAFDENRGGMTQGWAGSLDQLTAYLAQLAQK